MALLRWLTAIAMSVSLLAAPPARGVADFEKSNFCRKYRCVLSDPIEPLRMRGVIVEYFYNYRVYFPDRTQHSGQFGLRLTTDGSHGNPYLIVRWYPATAQAMTESDVRGIKELVDEIAGATDFDAGAFVLKFAAHPVDGYGPEEKVQGVTVQCSYTRSTKNQVTLLVY